jgi:hypothetical protein
MTAMVIAYIATFLMLSFLIVKLLGKIEMKEKNNDKLIRRLKEYEDKFNNKYIDNGYDAY